jgi:hypothetical protein
VDLGPWGLAVASRLRDVGSSVIATSRSEATRRHAHAAGIDVIAHARDQRARTSVKRRLPPLRTRHVAPRRAAGTRSLPRNPGLLSGEKDSRVVQIDTSTFAPRDAQPLTADLPARG